MLKKIPILLSMTALAACGTNQFPAKAVVAFDRSAGCPFNWYEYKPAMSRFIVGASNNADRRNSTLPETKHNNNGEDSKGGAHKHRHASMAGNTGITSTDHQKKSRRADNISTDAAYFVTENTHGHTIPQSDQQSNYAPYVALYFCTNDKSLGQLQSGHAK